jgi:GAF domain-containing protein
VYLLFLVPVAGATYLFGQRGGLVTLISALLIKLSSIRSMPVNGIDAVLDLTASALVGYMVILILACLRRNVSRLRAINVVSTALADSQELDAILRIALDVIVETLEAEAGVVYLKEGDGDQQDMTLVHSRNLPPGLIENQSGVESARAVGLYKRFRHRLVVPIRSKERVNGLVMVGQSWPRTSLCRERELVTTICNQINVFIENDRLYQDIAHQFEIERSVYEVVDEITSELEMARVPVG